MKNEPSQGGTPPFDPPLIPAEYDRVRPGLAGHLLAAGGGFLVGAAVATLALATSLSGAQSAPQPVPTVWIEVPAAIDPEVLTCREP